MGILGRWGRETEDFWGHVVSGQGCSSGRGPRGRRDEVETPTNCVVFVLKMVGPGRHSGVGPLSETQDSTPFCGRTTYVVGTLRIVMKERLCDKKVL